MAGAGVLCHRPTVTTFNRHYNARLSQGVLCGDRVTCPWHAACFNVTTGDIEDGPVLDALQKYDVK